MRLPPLQISLLTTPATDTAGLPCEKPRLDIVTLPSFADRQDLMLAHHKAAKRTGLAFIRVCCAAIGLTTRIGRESGTDFTAHDCSVLAYGGAIYGHLTENGVGMAAIGREGGKILDHILAASVPTEVATAEKNSEAGEAGST